MARPVEIRVPDMGGFKDVAIIDVLVKPGDIIAVDTPLVTLETDKATMDVPSTAAGVVEQVHIAKGGKVSEGDLIATVSAEGAGAAAAPAPAAGAAEPVSVAAPPSAAAPPSPAPAPAAPAPKQAAPAQAAPPAPAPATAGAEPNVRVAGVHWEDDGDLETRPVIGGRADLPPINEPGFSRAHASPSVRKFARELGVDLTRVPGTGLKQRITHEDVKVFVKKVLTGRGAAPGAAPGRGALPAVPAVDFEKFGPIEVKPLSRIQRISGPRLHASWVNLPHVTQFDEADITALEDARNKLKQNAESRGIKLTPLAFIVRACVKALQEFPQFNASLDAAGENLIFKKYFHIGFAADTPQGLVVPVVQNADRCDIYELARQLAELADKARKGKLTAAEMQGGTFTISSLGGIGGTAFTPIINAPEVAILGVSRSAMKPVFQNGAFVPRLMLPLCLSYDHRVIDGATAVRFTTFLARTLADPGSLTEAVP